MNYRSQSHVVEFVNATFGAALEHYIPQHVPATKSKGGYVCVEEHEESEIGVVKAVQRLLDAGVEADAIAVLVQTNADATHLKTALQEANAQLHVSTQSTLKLRDVPLVQALIECAKYSYFKAPLSWHNVVGLCGTKQPAKCFAFDAPLEEVFRRMVVYLGIDGTHPNVIAFIEAVQRLDDIEVFLFDLERFDVLAPEQHHVGIKVLTVHKSKGLEFDYVVISDRLKGENNRSGPLLFDYEGSTLKTIYYVQKQREHVDSAYAKAKAREKERQAKDQLNMLYVAFTRGREGVMVVKKPEKSLFAPLALALAEWGSIAPTKTQHSAPLHEGMAPCMPPPLGKQEVMPVEEDETSTLEARQFGQALHEVLENMPTFTQEALNSALKRVRQRGRYMLYDAAWQNIQARLDRLIKADIFRSLIAQGEHHKEQPLMFEGERKQIDLLIESEAGYVIVDYKSGAVPHETHEAQVLGYKRAMEAITAKPVSAWLFYLGGEQIQTISL
jgi:ATP-dependent exoDNAse (exonuclease V) beta subunit